MFQTFFSKYLKFRLLKKKSLNFCAKLNYIFKFCRSSSSGSSSHSPHRHNFHSASCRHFSGGGPRGADRTDSPGVATLGHQGGGVGSTLASSQNKLIGVQHHHQRSSSQDTETGNDSSSSNSNQVCPFFNIICKFVFTKLESQMRLEFKNLHSR